MSNIVSLNRSYHFKLFKGCLPQILLPSKKSLTVFANFSFINILQGYKWDKVYKNGPFCSFFLIKLQTWISWVNDQVGIFFHRKKIKITRKSKSSLFDCIVAFSYFTLPWIFNFQLRLLVIQSLWCAVSWC